MDTGFDFANQTVFVAGGSSGINLGIAKAFARAGAHIAVFSRSTEKITAAVRDLEAAGANAALGFCGDVRDIEAVGAALLGTFDTYGDIDILVSGAAGNFSALAKDLSPNGFKAVVDIDLVGSFNVLHTAFQYLRKPGARIINISAPQAVNPTIAQIHVCAAKAGVDMLTRVLALEWGEYGIRINSIMPGPIAGTEGMRRLAPTPQALETIRDSVPLGRIGQIDDIASAALLLASSHASFVTGAILPVDGGWSLGGDSAAMRTILPALAQQRP